jgi:hypothetical protein
MVRSFCRFLGFAMVLVLGSGALGSRLNDRCAGGNDPLDNLNGLFATAPMGELENDLKSRKDELIKKYNGNKEDLIYLRQSGEGNDALNILKEGLHLINKNPLALSLSDKILELSLAGSLFTDGKKDGGLRYSIDVLERSPQRSGQQTGNPRYLITVFAGGNKVLYQFLINTDIDRMMARVCGREFPNKSEDKWHWIVNYVK